MKLNLGCGSCIKPGWINLDLEPVSGATFCDLTKGLPYQDRSILYIYSEHMIEHLDWTQAAQHLKECYRVLGNWSVLRISTPDLATLIANYNNKSINAYRAVGFLPFSPGNMVNDGMRQWGHKYLFDEADMREILKIAGFKPENIRICKWGESHIESMCNLETRPNLGDLIVEATKVM